MSEAPASAITVRIEHETNSGDTGEVELLPREYFDPDLIEAGEPLTVDSDPLHFDSADYLEVPPHELKWVKLAIRDEEAGRMLTFHTSYWNGGKNQLTAKTEWNEGVIVDEAITFSVVTAHSPAVNHVVRAVSQEGVLLPVYHRVFTAEESGEQEETIL